MTSHPNPQSQAGRPAWSVSLARTEEQVEDLRACWTGLDGSRHLDIDFFLVVLRQRAAIIRPHVLLLSRNGRPATLLVARIEDVPIPIRFGYWTICRPRMRRLVVHHGGILGNSEDEPVRLLWEELKQALRRREAQMLHFNGIRTDSSFYRHVREDTPWFRRDWKPGVEPHWQIVVPQEYETFHASRSKNVRRNISRCASRIRREFGDEAVLRVFREESEIDRIMADAEAVAAKSYLRGLGVGFMPTQENRLRLQLASREGALRAYFLYFRNVPAAFILGRAAGERLHLNFTAHDAEFEYFSPGAYVMVQIIRDACRDPGIRFIDFGFGDALYKRNYCNDKWMEVFPVVYAARPYCILLNVLRGTNAVVAGLAQRQLERLGIVQRVKKAWRTRIRRQVGRAQHS